MEKSKENFPLGRPGSWLKQDLSPLANDNRKKPLKCIFSVHDKVRDLLFCTPGSIKNKFHALIRFLPKKKSPDVIKRQSGKTVLCH